MLSMLSFADGFQLNDIRHNVLVVAIRAVDVIAKVTVDLAAVECNMG